MSYFKRTLGLALIVAGCGVASAFAAEATLDEVYQAVEAGKLADAQAMMQPVLQNHPNSAKAHYVEAQILARSGHFASARGELETAEHLAPLRSFADPQAVAALRARLGNANGGLVAAPMHLGSHVPWGLILVGGGVLFALVAFGRALSARPVGPTYGPVPANGSVMPGAVVAPTVVGGTGGGLLGGLATGAAMGAGLVAGETLAHRLMDGPRTNMGYGSPADTTAFTNPTDVYPEEQDFGVQDTSSWDDSSSWDVGGSTWDT